MPNEYHISIQYSVVGERLVSDIIKNFEKYEKMFFIENDGGHPINIGGKRAYIKNYMHDEDKIWVLTYKLEETGMVFVNDGQN